MAKKPNPWTEIQREPRTPDPRKELDLKAPYDLDPPIWLGIEWTKAIFDDETYNIREQSEAIAQGLADYPARETIITNTNAVPKLAFGATEDEKNQAANAVKKARKLK